MVKNYQLNRMTHLSNESNLCDAHVHMKALSNVFEVPLIKKQCTHAASAYFE